MANQVSVCQWIRAMHSTEIETVRIAEQIRVSVRVAGEVVRTFLDDDLGTVQTELEERLRDALGGDLAVSVPGQRSGTLSFPQLLAATSKALGKAPTTPSDFNRAAQLARESYNIPDEEQQTITFGDSFKGLGDKTLIIFADEHELAYLRSKYSEGSERRSTLGRVWDINGRPVRPDFTALIERIRAAPPVTHRPEEEVEGAGAPKTPEPAKASQGETGASDLDLDAAVALVAKIMPADANVTRVDAQIEELRVLFPQQTSGQRKRIAGLLPTDALPVREWLQQFASRLIKAAQMPAHDQTEFLVLNTVVRKGSLVLNPATLIMSRAN